MRAVEIQEILMHHWFSNGHSPITTNFQGGGLSECDVISVSKAGLIYEFEIKRSRNDFNADFKKVHKHRMLAEKDATVEYAVWEKGQKTEKMETYINIPSYFYYVCIEDLIPKDKIPEYAGLIYVHKDEGEFNDGSGEKWENTGLRIVKRAKQLHKHKCTVKLLRAMARRLTALQLFGSSYMTHVNKMQRVIR